MVFVHIYTSSQQFSELFVPVTGEEIGRRGPRSPTCSGEATVSPETAGPQDLSSWPCSLLEKEEQS